MALNLRHSFIMVFGVTVTDIVSFILRYRGNKVVSSWTVDELNAEISRGIEEKCMCVDVVNGRVVGVIVGKKEENNIHVTLALTKRDNSLGSFMSWFLKHYSGYSLTATRRGKRITYDINKLTSKLCS